MRQPDKERDTIVANRRTSYADLTITLLTGQRPDLLDITLGSIVKNEPQLLEEAFVIVLHNSGDKETRDILYKYREYINFGIETLELLPIGQAFSTLLNAVKRQGHLMLLEDDWEMTASYPGWYDDARMLLDGVSQVRLRHFSEPVLNRHMVTGHPLKWETKPGWNIGKAHFTMNVSLIRATDIRKLIPCSGERDAQKKWLMHGGEYVAQLKPGLFRHIGDGRSLREITGCEP